MIHKDLSFWDKLLIRLLPKIFLRKAARRQGLNPKLIDYTDKIFRNAARIDLEPLSGSNRGLIITIDQKFSLWFFQDGDHFVYDGFEMGEYDKGKVTVFDNIKSNEET